MNGTAPDWRRFAHWPRGAALGVLAAFALLLGLAVITARQPVHVQSDAALSGPAQVSAADTIERDEDLRLYDRIAERVAAGEDYYQAAVEEQRARGFPVRPGLTVRLPTLALLTATLGQPGMVALAALLGLAVLAAWWRRLGSEPGSGDKRVICMLLLVIGSSLALKPQYLVLHELWAGLLLALSFALHRPGRWIGAWVAAALALALRELALPFVLLMGALALWRRDWREAAAWAGLVGLFVAGMVLHLSQASQVVSPEDPASPAWLVLRGLRGWTSNLQLNSVLQYLPAWLAAPLALLPLIGWISWRSDAGIFGTLLHSGYGLFFMLAGRDNNFYWALVVIPTWFLGLAFMPGALRDLWRAALGKT
ncbi:hypothetical protein KK137_15240 [Croceibacterium sp. LX-88]|uniref:DUF2029 domain-containing protein n=1 Tax=Croceibacterium selenioxidans TaxID=2838833 RepID=A0ABS5W7G7_9SPHN|nr:hypothetical protein [Croceibacterium selenioxidans]MBT2135693.1 hypothetical protein [Croceibacterium selenioxidans]